MNISASRVLGRFLTATALAISPDLERAIQTVQTFLKGGRRAKFDKGIGVLTASIAAGQWLPRGKVTVQSAVYQGIVQSKNIPHRWGYAPEASETGSPAWDEYNELESSLVYGRPYRGKLTIPSTHIKVPENVQQAWFAVCIGVRELCDVLDRIRPKPVITSIGLSPKVTKTLEEMDLDLDLSTLKIPPVEKIGEQPKIDRKTGKPVLDRYGVPMMEDVYKVMWSVGTVFRLSRFAYADCEACGKRIPSNMYVPVEVDGSKDGKPVHAGLHIGVDCARNIFGIKDKGFNLVRRP
jgi:hypothetical protein